MFAAAGIPAARATKRPHGRHGMDNYGPAPHRCTARLATILAAREISRPYFGGFGAATLATTTAVSARVPPLGQHQLAVAALYNCGGTLLIDQTLDARRRRYAPAASARSYGRGARINGDHRPVSPFVFGGPDVRYSIAGHGCHAARDCSATTVIRSITAWASRIWPTRHMSWVLPWASNIGFNTRCRAARALSARTSESDTG